MAVALAVYVEVEVVGAAWPVDGDRDCASVGCPKVAGEVDGEEEVVAEIIHRVSAGRAC